MRARIIARVSGDDGASMVEYGFLLVTIALVVAVGAGALGISARDFYESVAAMF